jgi:serine/threonine-protein kinase HipA
MEMLYYAGDDRFGALGVSNSRQTYHASSKLLLPKFADMEAMHTLVLKVLNGERVDESQRRLIAPGTTMGGARPKALIDIAGAAWVLKFAEQERMTLASKAQIRVAATRAFKLKRGYAVAVKRFDRAPGQRVHALSANVALRAAGADLSYPSLAQLLRRRGDTQGGINQLHMRELFRRLIFNILIDNTDDHEKNHVLLMTDAQTYQLSPAFDVLPTQQALGYQAMGVGLQGAVSSVENALSMSPSYGLKRQAAIDEVKLVAKVVQRWRSHFKARGLDAHTIDSLSAQIDRPQLREQREHFAQ